MACKLQLNQPAPKEDLWHGLCKPGLLQENVLLCLNWHRKLYISMT